MTPKEWIALARACALEQSAETVYSVLDLMKRSASPVTDEILNEVLSVYAEKGDVQVVETLFQKCLTEAPTERQRHLHIKSCLRADVTSEIPTRALELLHDYEARGLPAPQQTYTRCITHLFSAGSSVAHAHAWDLFAHMRYAAHPVPDVLLYTLMIRACANSSFSTGVEPERALDLFHEMTVDQRIEPTSGAYTAAILACARSGSKDYVHEAFRLAKQMLDSHRDARGNPAFSPDARFFKALLEGAKRIGDLGRARWILAEMVRVAGEMERKEAGSSASLRVDEDVMVHVFNAYTTYKPPFKRSATKVVDTPLESVPQAQEEAEMSSASSASSERKELVNPPQKSTFTHLPPQTRAELVAEVRLLMDQIVERNRPEGGDEAAAGRFKHVHLTPRLVNAYLSVHYAHTSLDTAIECYQHIFADLGVPRNSQSYVEALERFSKVKKDQREDVRSLGDEIWSEWQGVEAAWRRGDPTSLRLTARIIERAHTAMIRLLSITGQLDRALDHVKTFVELYPFAAVRRPGPQHASRSTRTVLAAARPLVRFTSALDIPDDTVPPFLSFPEVELLHHKLVVSDKVEGIKYLQWVCKSYAGALSIRRDRILAVRKADSEMEDVD
ncbi:hypothetical protein EUX98_g6203 [Antrodiella citrinella]|uniref:Pentacotripeptide-repeat region of PRORP domain-containing protein n=1 Tax=Antrodiella citrinella TaxID=2447956 RepID=A0A4S4MPJ3_9APHY|nr:hypothetical protein EUX98_g6203 [Antrodiella citrinella]